MTNTPSKDPTTQPEPWNEVAIGYDEAFTRTTPALTDEIITAIAPSKSDTVLDVATGPGTLALRLAPKVARVVAVDFAERMIERLRANVEAAGLTNVDVRTMDGHTLTFEDESFDAVASMFGWFLFADRARAMREMHRVLRPSGRVVVSSWLPPAENTVLGTGLEALRAAIPDMPRPAGPLPTQIPDVCAGEVREAGFRDVAARTFRLPIEFESIDAYWNMQTRAGAPIAVLKKKLGEDGWSAVAARTLGHLREKHGAGSVTLTIAGIITTGVR
jgi:SAM-dependent methyltransferase